MARGYLSVPNNGWKLGRYVREAFASNWLSGVEPQLERAFAERVGRPAAALSSGNGAMHQNYRMSSVLAAIGRGQLEVLDERVRQRRAVALRYRDAFADQPGIELCSSSPDRIPRSRSLR